MILAVSLFHFNFVTQIPSIMFASGLNLFEDMEDAMRKLYHIKNIFVLLTAVFCFVFVIAVVFKTVGTIGFMECKCWTVMEL